MHTPWGLSQQQKKIADGITSYSTASHGGYHVSAERLAEMPECIRDFTTYAGAGWYEEDCDWCLVVLSFPSLFDARSCYYAVKTLKMSVATVPPPADEVLADACVIVTEATLGVSEKIGEVFAGISPHI